MNHCRRLPPPPPLLRCCRDLSYNQFTGNMPDSWSEGPAFLNLVDLQVGCLGCLHAAQLPFPAGCLVACSQWGQIASAAKALHCTPAMIPDELSSPPAARCLLPLRAPLPCVQLAGNRLSGPFPAGFAVTNTSFISLMSL